MGLAFGYGVTIAEELVEDHADCEQVGGDFPASEVGVGGWYGGVPDWVRTGSPSNA
jgi:hypothetical protein